MFLEDQKRLEREADIAKAIRDPDYSVLDSSTARNKTAFNAARQAQTEANQRFDIHTARQKALYDSLFTPSAIVLSRRKSQRGSYEQS